MVLCSCCWVASGVVCDDVSWTAITTHRLSCSNISAIFWFDSVFYNTNRRRLAEKVNQSINQSIRDCLSSRATSRLIVCLRNAGSDDNVRIWFLKSQVLSCWRKVEGVCDVVISSGRVFQTRGPATVNARSPTVERLTDGTIRWLVPPERSVRRPGWSATGTSGPRYRGGIGNESRVA